MSLQLTTINQIRLATFDAACAAVGAGLSLIPICGDGTKRPAWNLLPRLWSDASQAVTAQWKPYECRQPTLDELTIWFLMPRIEAPCGFAVLGGAISGGLEIIDFDMAELFDVWAARIHQLRPQLLETLTIVRSPRPGIHVYFRSGSVGPCRKLAQRQEVDEHSGRPKLKTLIEVKAQGGYVLAPGCPANCHPTGRHYEFVTGNGFAQIPTVNFDDRNLMLIEAMRLDEAPAPHTRLEVRPVRSAQSNRPGDLFAAATSWETILEPHGWTQARRSSGGPVHWCRPGKSSGTSATTNHADTDLLYVFSANASPFECGGCYSKFAAFTILNYGGEFSAAAADLVARGFTQPDAGSALPHWRRRRPRLRRLGSRQS